MASPLPLCSGEPQWAKVIRTWQKYGSFRWGGDAGISLFAETGRGFWYALYFLLTAKSLFSSSYSNSKATALFSTQAAQEATNLRWVTLLLIPGSLHVQISPHDQSKWYAPLHLAAMDCYRVADSFHKKRHGSVSEQTLQHRAYPGIWYSGAARMYSTARLLFLALFPVLVRIRSESTCSPSLHKKWHSSLDKTSEHP